MTFTLEVASMFASYDLQSDSGKTFFSLRLLRFCLIKKIVLCYKFLEKQQKSQQIS